jgi:hypothetical protein
MFMSPAFLSAVPTGVVDMTEDFAPLLLGLIVGVCLGVLALAFAIGVYDTRYSRRRIKKSRDCPAQVPELRSLQEVWK